MCSRSLSFGQGVDRLDSLTYMENITDAYSQYFINDIEHTENSVKRENCHLNRFLSASAWSSLSSLIKKMHCLLTSLLMCCYSLLHGKQFPNILKTTYFHMHTYISEFVIPLCCRYQVVLSCTCKEYSNDMQFLATSLYYNPTTYTR